MSELSIKDYLECMDLYIEKLRKQGTAEEATEALIRIGVLEKDGKTISERHRLGIKK